MGKKPDVHFCDVCNAEMSKPNHEMIQVIFTTEQTEGRSVKPYLCNCDFDICSKCHDIILDGNYLYAHGAMGFNNYYFKTKGE